VLALPSESTVRRERLFHHRGCINEDLHVAASRGRKPAREFFQACLDEVVIVITLGVDGNGCVGPFSQDCQRIIIWPVVHSEHDD